jgi:putative salt-induced outer membrane protein YdiY
VGNELRFPNAPYWCIISALLPGLALADQVTLKNGDIVTGAVVRKDGDKLTFKSELLGEVTIPWPAVTSIKSDNPLYVVLPGGKEVSGKVTTQGSEVAIAAPAAPATVPLAQISTIRDEAEQSKYERLQSPSWFDLWAGAFDLGFAAARGNAHTTTLTTAFNSVRVTRNDKTRIYFNQIYSSATINGQTAATAKAMRGGWSYDHNLTPRFFLNVFNDYEHDRFQNLDLRFVGGGGAGFHLTKNERNLLDLLGGMDYDHDSFSNHMTRNALEAFAGDDWNYKLSGITSVTQSFRIFESLTDTGDYRVNFDLGTATTLHKRLSWQVTASDRFLSTPAFGRKRNDILLSTGFRLSFAQ